MIAAAAFFLVRDSPESYDGFHYLGWEGSLAWTAITALHIQRGDFLAAFLFGFSLMAIVNTAMYCGFAAVVWSVFSLFARGAGTRRRIGAKDRYGLSVLLAACALGVANNLQFMHGETCSDCVERYGTPFTLLLEGGFIGIRRYVWSGLIGDAFVVLVVGLVIGLVWNKLAVRYSNQQ